MMFRNSLLTAAILSGITLTAAAQESPKPVDLAAEYQSLINTDRAFAKKSMLPQKAMTYSTSGAP